MSDEKVWFITGSSRGFGRVWTEAALKRGDKVVATARNPTVLHSCDCWKLCIRRSIPQTFSSLSPLAPAISISNRSISSGRM